ncbi:conserved hypothetical protein [Theileria equi strain WA]|uniref:Uncharacterized protein n=1 Tax=Theileria equi strain WA TaxID=1537102 RepID=L1LDN0_THEEQ|nr:conserved hypothetical protein [Theileria equi strain WA]EKX73248.1 conserved hypothetical protein [Theileria equi strain WA]|eukprot:XP_004832700.1 conserved hypothetical protein [Theileria equi strain WA]
MSKNTETHNSTKTDVDDALTSYLQMKSPLIGPLEFDVSLPPPPTDPKLLDYEANKGILKYELTGLELSERIATFHDFTSGISNNLLNGLCFTGCGVEDKELLDSIDRKLFPSGLSEHKNSAEAHKIASLQRAVRNGLSDVCSSFDELKMSFIVNKAKEGLPINLKNLLSSNLDTTVITPDVYRRTDTNLESAMDQKPENYENWNDMDLDQRVSAYINEIKKTFVSPEYFTHPTNKHAKPVRVYKVLPNLKLWNNKYIQVGIDGLTSKKDSYTQLEVDGILKVAKDTPTHRIYEYYRRHHKDSTNSSPNHSNLKELGEDPNDDSHLFEDSDPFKDEVLDSPNHSGPYQPQENIANNNDSAQEIDDIDDLFNDELEEANEDIAMASVSDDKATETLDDTDTKEESNLFRFVRQYSCQKSTKMAENGNYYLLSLPRSLHDKFKRRLDPQANLDRNWNENQTIEILPLKGQKYVFSKAGGTKRPNISISYSS